MDGWVMGRDFLIGLRVSQSTRVFAMNHPDTPTKWRGAYIIIPERGRKPC